MHNEKVEFERWIKNTEADPKNGAVDQFDMEWRTVRVGWSLSSSNIIGQHGPTVVVSSLFNVEMTEETMNMTDNMSSWILYPL